MAAARGGEIPAVVLKQTKHLAYLHSHRIAAAARNDGTDSARCAGANFAGKFEALIESYNAGSRIESLFEELLALPRAYTPELYRQKCSAVFEHVYESYPERGAGLYAPIGSA